MACVIADHYLRQRGQVGETPAWPFKKPSGLKECQCSSPMNVSKRPSQPLPAARSSSSPTTTTARTRAICSSRPRCARRRRWPSSSATPRASSARRCRRDEARRLHLDPMVASNDAPLGTAFTVTVDVRHGLTTGISAEERTNTVRALANGNSGAADFVRPGHVFPLVAKDGGVLMRSGHTEACIDLCRLAGLPPVGVLSELMNDDGTVMRGPGVAAFARAPQAHADLDRRPDRLPAGAREAGQAGRRVSGQERDRHADRLRLCDAVRRGPSHGRRARQDRRRQERAGAAAPRRHHPRRVRRRQSGARRAAAASSRKAAACSSILRDGAAGVPTQAIPSERPELGGRAHQAMARGRPRRADPQGPRHFLDPPADLGQAHLCRAWPASASRSPTPRRPTASAAFSSAVAAVPPSCLRSATGGSHAGAYRGLCHRRGWRHGGARGPWLCRAQRSADPGAARRRGGDPGRRRGGARGRCLLLDGPRRAGAAARRLYGGADLARIPPGAEAGHARPHRA